MDAVEPGEVKVELQELIDTVIGKDYLIVSPKDGRERFERCQGNRGGRVKDWLNACIGGNARKAGMRRGDIGCGWRDRSGLERRSSRFFLLAVRLRGR